MTKQNAMNTLFRIFLSALVVFISLPAHAWQNLSRDIDIECLQSGNRLKINCDYRLINSTSVSDIQARIGDQNLQITGNDTWPWSTAKTAVLFLIDTSDPARQNVVARNLVHLEKLLGSLDDRHLIGLATFDKDLTVLAPPGSGKDEILAAAQQVRAVGRTTELYRNMINAIETLARIQADRKTIFLFSDGLAEDKAYFHSDVVASARKHKVVINSLGYPRSVALSVALQIIRRISEETGGYFIEVDEQLNLPDDFMNNPLNWIETGGRFTVDLENVDYSNIPENSGITLAFSTDVGSFDVKLPVQRPAVTRKVTETAQAAEAVTGANTVEPAPAPTQTQTVSAPAPAPRTVTVAQQPAARGLDQWFLYGIPIALVVLLLLTIASLVMSFIKPRERNIPKVQIGDLKPYAYLVTQDETKRRYPITRTTWRIGRSKDNELALDDNSISRRHAEIHRSQGDEFTVIDLDSLNGVFINNEKVKIQQLKEGDILEIGDINFRFTLHSAEYPLEESTVMQKTKTPSYTH
ncbi:MAG: FHA domain-containing protein [Thiotrichales bacterium]|nr:FHA domain-containing protein [Thiotrichales bacterium]